MPVPLQWTKDDEYKIDDILPETEWQIIDKNKRKKQPSSQNNTEGQKACKRAKTNLHNYVPAQGTIQLIELSNTQGTRFNNKCPAQLANNASDCSTSKRQKIRLDRLQHLDKSPKGFDWNGKTYSCAFDSLFIILTHVMSEDTANWTELTLNANENLIFFCETFDGMISTSDDMEYARDIVHEFLAEKYPLVFITSPQGNDMIDLCEYLLSLVENLTLRSLYCSQCKTELSSTLYPQSLIWKCTQGKWRNKSIRHGTFNGQTTTAWMKALMHTKSQSKCSSCQNNANVVYSFQDAPSFITILLDNDIVINPEHIMIAGGFEYRLRA
jgi:hypothetical protein